MRRDEFMRELEYLLQDISDEDKADAIAYYQDYLDEAGPEHEEEVIRGFGSPERIAAIIRADLNGNLEEGGEFTDQGYEDERFREPNFQLVNRLDLPESAEEAEQTNGRNQAGGAGWAGGSSRSQGTSRASGESGAGGRSGSFQYGGRWHDRAAASSAGSSGTGGETPRSGRPRWAWWQILGMILLGCIVIPIVIPLLLGLGGGAIGLIAGLGGGAVGLLAVLISVTIALAAVTFALLLAGVLLILFGIGYLANPAQGFLYIGTGVGILGLGFLCLALCGLYYGKFLPWLGRSIINFISRLLHRKGASVV
ncbi:MAG: hypothetical protein Q4C66_01585 [Lachnospiraceae bacterium]|nr:hypothetical protein [Lachnospiraceae bacterium]